MPKDILSDQRSLELSKENLIDQLFVYAKTSEAYAVSKMVLNVHSIKSLTGFKIYRVGSSQDFPGDEDALYQYRLSKLIPGENEER